MFGSRPGDIQTTIRPPQPLERNREKRKYQKKMDEKLDSIDPPDSRNVFLTFTDLFLFCQNYFIQFCGVFFQLKSFPAVSSISGFLAPASSAGSRWLEILFFFVVEPPTESIERGQRIRRILWNEAGGRSPMQTGTHLDYYYTSSSSSFESTRSRTKAPEQRLRRLFVCYPI